MAGSEDELVQGAQEEGDEKRRMPSPSVFNDMDGASTEQIAAHVRKVRGRYRELQESVETGRRNLIDTSVEELGHQVLAADKLFREVKGPSEAILDSKVLVAASDAGAIKARQLKLDMNAFDTDEFILKVAQFLGGKLNHGQAGNSWRRSKEAGTRASTNVQAGNGSRAAGKRRREVGDEEVVSEDGEESGNDDERGSEPEMDWYKCGKTLCRFSRRIPTIDFMYGPIETDVKVRAAATQRQNFRIDDAQRVRPEEIQSDDITKDPQETSKMVTVIFKTLQSFGNGGVPYLKFIVNPDSFPQTVENMFYFSFLVKEGRAAIQIEEEEASEYVGDTITYATVPPTAEDLESKAAERRQMVFELTQDVWRDAIDAYDITESCIPSRDTTEGINQPGRKRRW